MAGEGKLLAAYTGIVTALAISAVALAALAASSALRARRARSDERVAPGDSSSPAAPGRGPSEERPAPDRPGFHFAALPVALLGTAAVSLLPWAAVFQTLGPFGYGLFWFHTTLVGVALLYAWAKGAFE